MSKELMLAWRLAAACDRLTDLGRDWEQVRAIYHRGIDWIKAHHGEAP